ncbi:MAG: glutathione S-transferase family protein, partial [Deltaproteobacteria bacterium]
MTLPVLWHFTISHFNEKVRWALDFKRVPHLRRALLPGSHFLKIWRMTGQTALPVLVLDGRPIHDSTRIIAALERAHPEPPLYPRNEPERRRALELENF